MPAIINKPDARKTVRDVSEAMAKTGTSRDVTRKNAEAAEQNLQKAADALRGTMGRSAETVSDAVDATLEISGRTTEQLDQMSALRDKASKELAGRTHQNLDAMIQTGIKLAEGFQLIMREWADYTRNAMQCNIDGMNSIMSARTPQDLMAAQRELLNAEVQVVLNSSVRISEAMLRVAKDAAQSIDERTRQRNQ